MKAWSGGLVSLDAARTLDVVDATAVCLAAVGDDILTFSTRRPAALAQTAEIHVGQFPSRPNAT
jgi:hypothetical protein